MTLTRRSLITGLVSFAAVAPAIVRAGALMPVKVMEDARRLTFIQYAPSSSAMIYGGSGWLSPADPAAFIGYAARYGWEP